MTTFDPARIDFDHLEYGDFVRLVKSASGSDLDQLMNGELRTRVLDEIFTQMAARVRKDRTAGMDAVIRWRISRAGGDFDRYELHIANGACTVGPGSDAQPRLTITVDGANFLRLVSGVASGPALFMTKKLQLTGDIAVGAGLTGYFDIPKA
ncbi:SCP2 sterol-binding domain-containing protein [Fodinicola acaciae]|uniref:SCP2 sterol-binding domain-containing protein n=1 Tax=Fodinicola acaciae TaxID=2681555 RepID=UPI0013D05802|nr:SCP2 sterol-binding domain-containing protein [Fodinicola acaciae]